jgi:hypothetical protein
MKITHFESLLTIVSYSMEQCNETMKKIFKILLTLKISYSLKRIQYFFCIYQSQQISLFIAYLKG